MPADIHPVANAQSHLCTNVSNLELRAVVTVAKMSKSAAKSPPQYCTKYCHAWAAAWQPLVCPVNTLECDIPEKGGASCPDQQ